MKTYLISDNQDTKVGLRLAGIDGIIVNTKEEVLNAFKELLRNPEVEIIIVTEKISLMAEKEIMKWKTDLDRPLIVEIPNPDVKGRKDYILKYIKESIGLNI
jgi:V/A-type H+-transporting ATPase subunit F